MINNITFQLTKFPKALAFAIESQTEEWREKRNETILPCEVMNFYSKGFEIFSYINPYITITPFRKKISLWGKNRKANNFVSIKSFNSNTQRDKYHDLIIEALKEWSKMVYKLRGVEPQEPKQEGDRYEL